MTKTEYLATISIAVRRNEGASDARFRYTAEVTIDGTSYRGRDDHSGVSLGEAITGGTCWAAKMLERT